MNVESEVRKPSERYAESRGSTSGVDPPVIALTARVWNAAASSG
jgi:hypothetical protein